MLQIPFPCSFKPQWFSHPLIEKNLPKQGLPIHVRNFKVTVKESNIYWFAFDTVSPTIRTCDTTVSSYTWSLKGSEPINNVVNRAVKLASALDRLSSILSASATLYLTLEQRLDPKDNRGQAWWDKVKGDSSFTHTTRRTCIWIRNTSTNERF